MMAFLSTCPPLALTPFLRDQHSPCDDVDVSAEPICKVPLHIYSPSCCAQNHVDVDWVTTIGTGLASQHCLAIKHLIAAIHVQCNCTPHLQHTWHMKLNVVLLSTLPTDLLSKERRMRLSSLMALAVVVHMAWQQPLDHSCS